MLIDRKEFEKSFLEAIKTFVPKAEFVPLTYRGDKLVTFCSNRQKNGTMALYLEHTPLACNMDDGDVIYIKDPQKLLAAIKLIPDERINLKVRDHQLLCNTDSIKMTFTLYDKILAKRDQTFWLPEKFDKIRGTFKDGVLIDKITLGKIKVACNVVDLDTCNLHRDDANNMVLTVGSTNSNSITTELPDCEDFSDESHFIKNLFNFLGKDDAIIYETEDEKVIGFKEEADSTNKFYIVTKIPIKK